MCFQESFSLEDTIKQYNDPIFFIVVASRKLRAVFLLIIGTFSRLLFTLYNVLGKGPVVSWTTSLSFFSYSHCELCNRSHFPLCFISKKSLANIGLGVSILLTTAFCGLTFSWLLIVPQPNYHIYLKMLYYTNFCKILRGTLGMRSGINRKANKSK